MHILHVTPYYAPAYAFGGVTRSVEGMTQALARRGHHVTVLTTDAFSQTSRSPAPPDEVREGVHVLRARNLSLFLRGRLNLSTPYSLHTQARAVLPDVDVIHCHEFRTVENLLVTSLAAGRPLVLSPHGTLTQHTGRGAVKRLWDRLLSPAVARRFQHVVGLTQDEVDEAQTIWQPFGAPDTTFSVIPNGVDPAAFEALQGGAAFRQRYGLGNAPVCLFMGRLHPRKGVGLLVEAFKKADIPDARLVIVGPDEGMLARLQAELDDRMVLTGYLEGADRLAAFAAADMLALPAVGEGLPMVALEAMAAGLPLLLSPGCHLPEVAQSGAGLEVEAALEPLIPALRQLLADAAARQRMGTAARALVHQRFTWDSVALQFERCYQLLLDTR